MMLFCSKVEYGGGQFADIWRSYRGHFCWISCHSLLTSPIPVDCGVSDPFRKIRCILSNNISVW